MEPERESSKIQGELSQELISKLEGCCAILRDDASRLAYARDLWPLGQISQQEALGRRPQAVACPRSESEVQALVRLANEVGLPLIPWGEGSGVCGGTIALRGGLAVDLKGLRAIEAIDRESMTVSVQAGINGRILEERLEREGLSLGHSPSSILCSTLGGWLAARSAGQFSTGYGKIEDMLVSLRVVLPNGELAETLAAPRAAAGPDWRQIFMGSEGTLGIITQACLKVHRLPESRVFSSFECASVEAGIKALRSLIQEGLRPSAVRLYDPLDSLLVGAGKDHDPLPSDPPQAKLSWFDRWSASGLEERLFHSFPKALKDLSKQGALSQPALIQELIAVLPQRCLGVLVFEGRRALIEVLCRESEAILITQGAKVLGPEPAERWYRNRHSVSFKQSEVYKLGAFVDTFEIATTWSRLHECYQKIRAALSPHVLVLAHFSHAYDEGCSIYFTMAARCASPELARERYRLAWESGLKTAVELGAAPSHHHGIGLLKADALKSALGALHPALQCLKDALDPKGIMNPGKLGLR